MPVGSKVMHPRNRGAKYFPTGPSVVGVELASDLVCWVPQRQLFVPRRWAGSGHGGERAVQGRIQKTAQVHEARAEVCQSHSGHGLRGARSAPPPVQGVRGAGHEGDARVVRKTPGPTLGATPPPSAPRRSGDVIALSAHATRLIGGTYVRHRRHPCTFPAFLQGESVLGLSVIAGSEELKAEVSQGVNVFSRCGAGTEAGQVVVEGAPPAVRRKVHALYTKGEAVGCIALYPCLNGATWHESVPAEEVEAGRATPPCGPALGPFLAEALPYACAMVIPMRLL